MPEQGVDKPENARELAIQRLKMKQDFKGLLAGGLFAIVVTVVIWALGEGGYFWPIWVCLGVAIGVVAQGWKAYGPSNRITEADVQRELSKTGDDAPAT
jgi:peptidoglycan/LPS O-acetylase OafA/YrhL